MAKLFRSLRWRLQIWNALILLLVVGGFTMALQMELHRMHWSNVDDELVAGARIIEGVLRQVPKPILESLSQDLSFLPGPGLSNMPPEYRAPGENGGAHSFPPRRSGRPAGTAPEHPPFRPPTPPITAPADLSKDQIDKEWQLENLGASDVESKSEQQWLAELQFPQRLPQPLGRSEFPTYYIAWRADGSIIHESNTPNRLPPAINAGDPMFLQHRYVVKQVDELRNIYVRGPRQSVVCVGRSVAIEQERGHHRDLILFATAFGVYSIGLLGGFFLSRKAVEPIASMTETAEKIGPTELHRRMDLAGVDSELAQLGDVLNGMLDRIETSFSEQQRFTADASHELRTPLSIMLSATDLALSRVRSAADYREQLEICNRSARRMQNIVESLLMLARVDAKSIGQEFSDCDWKSIVAEQVEEMRAVAESKSIVLESTLEDAHVHGAATLLARVVTNLLQNAVQYTSEPGVIRVTLSKVRRDTGDVARLSVSDTGEGIEVKDIPHLFNRFYRVDSARSRKTGGAGLGLAICKAVVELHKGTISVESTFGKGSTFTVDLPLHAQRDD